MDGRIVSLPDDPEEVATALDEMLQDPDTRHAQARNAQRRVHEMFLVFEQAASWLRVLAAATQDHEPGADWRSAA